MYVLKLPGIEVQNFTVVVLFSANSLYCSSTVENDKKIIA